MAEFAKQPDDDQKRRLSQRRKVLKSGLASFNAGHSTASCLIRDLSETGAKLVFADLSYVPHSFVLVVEMDGYRIKCERLWRSEQTCGVRFVGEKIPFGSPRSQALKSSEDSLSDRILRDISLREKSCPGEEPDTPPAKTVRSRPSGPVFGRRK